MSENNEAAVPSEAPEEPTPGSEDVPEPDEPGREGVDIDQYNAKIHKANNEAKNLRTRLRDAEEKLSQYEDASKSDSERTSEKLSAAEKRAEEAESRLLRLEVAQEKGLTAAQAKRLVGGTREELESDADELLDTFKVGSSGR